MYRVLILVVPLSLFGAMAWLFAAGHQPLYFTILSAGGVHPFSFPFLDLHAVLAAAECHRLGVDVYLSDPCDVLGRRHVYSPLWLDLVPGSWGTQNTNQLGIAIDLMFMCSLPLVLRARSLGEFLLFTAAILSTTVVYALERANNDIIIFLLIACTGGLFGGSKRSRMIAYALYILSGLLKFYPLALLVLVLRENWRTAIAVVTASVAAVLGLWLIHSREFILVVSNPLILSYFTDSFSAKNLPFGLAELLPKPSFLSQGNLAALIFLVLCVYCAFVVLKVFRILESNCDGLDSGGVENDYLLIGAILLTGCFFAGQNIDYRGIYLLMIVPGLLSLGRSAAGRNPRRLFAAAVAVALFLMWEEWFRSAIASAVDAGWWSWRAEPFYWICREVLWWWLIGFLAALSLSRLLRMTTATKVAFLLRKRNPLAPRSEPTHRGD